MKRDCQTKKRLMKTWITIFCIFLYSIISGQNWLQTGGGASHDEAFDVELDIQGNIYTTGYVTSTSQFGINVNVQTNGFSDVYVSKSDASGNFLWAKTFGGSGADRGYDIALDNVGNIYLTGYVSGTVTFDDITITTNAGSQDFFVAKLASGGEVLWVNVEGGAGGESGFGIETDSQSNVIVTGQFEGEALIGATTVQSMINPDDNTSSTDIFIVKYTSNGAPLWTRTGSGKYNNRGLALDVNSQDEILLTGQFSDTLLLAGETFNNEILNAGYLLKMDQSGNNLWFRRMGAYQTMVYDVEVDDDRVYVTGDFLGQMAIFGDDVTYLTGDYPYKIFLVRFDQSGTVEWTAVDASESMISSKAIAVDVNRDVYLSGTFKCNFTEYSEYLQGAGLFNSVGFSDVFITKYLQIGTREWMKQFGGPMQDYCSGIAVNQIDNPIIAGSYVDQFNVPADNSLFIPNSNNELAFGAYCNNQEQYYQYIESVGFKDVFVGKTVSLLNDDYYYYTANCYSDSLPSILGPDSISFCGEGEIFANTFTIGNGIEENGHIGPYYSYLWNTEESSSDIEVYASGWYSCQIDRYDECSFSNDSIFVQVNPIPENPVMTDDMGYNDQSYPYNNLMVCFPDTVLVNFELDSTHVTMLNGTEITADSIPIFLEQNYNVLVHNEFGCFHNEDFSLEYQYALIDTMVPYLVLESGLDSITICMDEDITLNCLDLLTNPSLNPSLPFATFVYPEGILMALDTTIQIYSTGWYTITYHPILGYDNLCGTVSTQYEVSATIHVTVNPNPVVAFSLDGITPFCPGDIVNIWTNNTYTNFNWQGPGIVDITQNGDSIFAIEVGVYQYGGEVVNPETGCSTVMTEEFVLTHKADPNIWSNVEDNLICPGDSLLLTCDAGLEYHWVGPLGQIIGETQSIWVEVPGFYHCVMLDFESCLLTSNTLELLVYNSPYLVPEPSTELCHTGSIEITVMHSGGPSFNWLSPINSTESVVTLEESGTYYVEVVQCGFTALDSIVITDSGFEAIIQSFDSLVCEGGEFVITSNLSMVTYEWSNGVVTTNNQLVVDEPGEYEVFVTSPNGCTAQSEIITLAYYDDWQLPIPQTITICDETSAVLIAEGSGDFMWLDNTLTSVLSVVDSLETPVLSESTTYFLIFSDSVCTSSPIAMNVMIDEIFLVTDIEVPSFVCEGDNLSITVAENSAVSYEWVLPDLTTSDSEILVLNDIAPSDSGEYTLQIMSDICIGDILTANVMVESSASIEMTYLDSTLCQDSLLITSIGDYATIDWYFEENFVANQVSELWTFLPGIYSVIVSNINGNCPASDQMEMINGSALPAPEVVGEIACFGQILQIDLNLENPFWTSDINLTNVQFDNILTTDPLTEDITYYIGVIDSNGCYSEISMLNIVVVTSPAPNVWYNEPVCAGQTIILETDVPGSTIVQWTFPDNTQFEGQILTIDNAAPSNQGSYSVVAINNNCITDTAEVEVVVNSLPTSPIITGETSYCLGDNIQLEFDNFVSDSITFWVFENSNVTGVVFEDIALTDFSVEAQYFDGTCSSSALMDITVNDNPIAGNIYTNSPVCVGESVTFSTDETPNTSYLWTGQLNFIQEGSSAELTFAVVETSGTYTLAVTNEYGCNDSSFTEVLVLSYPQVELGLDTIICPGAPILLSVEAGYDSYIWNTGDFSNELLVFEGGLYSVDVANGSCWTSDQIEIIDDCEPVFAPNIITPNGDDKNQRLFFKSHEITSLHVFVYNRWGTIVGEWSDLNGYWDGTHYLTGEELAEGTYYYVLEYIDLLGELQSVKSYITLLR